MNNKYDPVIKRIPENEYRKEIVFRIAGDGFLQIVYGDGKPSTESNLKQMILNAFRVIIINDIVKKSKIDGLIETIPGHESLLYKFDPLKINLGDLVNIVTDIENQVNNIENYEIETRFVRLPIVFDDSETKKAIQKYLNEIKPGAINCEGNSNLSYIASYNGITVEELKEKFVKTEWLVTMVGFFPGLPYYFPLDPTCAITAPKYNPARTWTAEGAVDLADYCSTIFGVESSGGYQLIGRTAPIFQANQIHKQYKDSPALFRPTDILQYYEVKEEELLDIYQMVKEGKWGYDICSRRFSLSEWLKFYETVKSEAELLRQKQINGRKVTSLP